MRDADSPSVLKPGILWDLTIERTRHALACGALQSLDTDCEFVEQDGVGFIMRTLSATGHRHHANKNQRTSRADFNPFLPCEEDLFVTDISATHLCLLNKFNIVDHHLLVVTRAFEEQESALNLSDFEALGACMAEIDGLAFYNSGEKAGASQRHKHLQLIPLPMVPTGPPVPIEPALALDSIGAEVTTSPDLAFLHALVRLDPSIFGSPLAASTLFEYYKALLDAVDLHVDADRPSAPYNLLATRQWMLLVPRLCGAFKSIPVNALGFAGSLLAKNAGQLQAMKEHGPMTILKRVVVSM